MLEIVWGVKYRSHCIAPIPNTHSCVLGMGANTDFRGENMVKILLAATKKAITRKWCLVFLTLSLDVYCLYIFILLKN